MQLCVEDAYTKNGIASQLHKIMSELQKYVYKLFIMMHSGFDLI